MLNISMIEMKKKKMINLFIVLVVDGIYKSTKKFITQLKEIYNELYSLDDVVYYWFYKFLYFHLKPL